MDASKTQKHLHGERIANMTNADLWEILELNPAEFEQPCTIDDLSLKNFAHHINEICAKMLTKFIRENRNRGKMYENTKGGNSGLFSYHNLKFLSTRDHVPSHHPSGSSCKPDMVITSSATASDLEWAEIEATVEIRSTGKDIQYNASEAGSYTIALLQARPDRVVVQGFLASEQGVSLVLTSAAGIKSTGFLDLNSKSDIKLLYAFVYR
ncbi:hypothetical protein CVT26_007332, partial [Gymnopilus dilepis]